MQIGVSVYPYNQVYPGRLGGTGASSGPLAPSSPSLPLVEDPVATQSGAAMGSLAAVSFPAPMAEAGAAIGKLTALNQALGLPGSRDFAGFAIPGASSNSADSSDNANSPNHAQSREIGLSEAANEDKAGQAGAEKNRPEEAGGEERGEERSEQELAPDEQREVRELRQRDMEVRAHEQAHVAAGGRYVTKAPSYEYEEGPDGQKYAVGGEVSIDTSPVPDDPRATMEKAQVIRRAALAPADPSSQDRRVASEAQSMEAQARAEMLRENQREVSGSSEQAGEQVRVASGSGEAGAANADIAYAGTPGADASARLRQRFAEFFPGAPNAGLSQFA